MSPPDAVAGTPRSPTCARCAAPMPPDAAFCEACGAAVATSLETEIGDRDHYGLTPAPWVAGICDRGVLHARNEDALALAALPAPGSHAALVVCDGVTSAPNSDVASLAAARASLAILAAPFSTGVAGEGSRAVAAGRTLERAAREAQTAVLRGSEGDTHPAGACTWVAAVVSGPVLWHGGIGDSRVYYVPDDGSAVLLTRDDSMAELLIDSGVSRAEAERAPVAHTITRWLGPDSSDLDPRAQRFDIPARGWVVACSDGLWNYASAPQEFGGVVQQAASEVADAGAVDPLRLAEALVAWANAQGGEDNVTVALARLS